MGIRGQMGMGVLSFELDGYMVASFGLMGVEMNCYDEFYCIGRWVQGCRYCDGYYGIEMWVL